MLIHSTVSVFSDVTKLIVRVATDNRNTKIQVNTLKVLILVIASSLTPTKSRIYQNVLCW